MEVAEVKFEREGREGMIAVGSYLIDTAKRFGVRFEGECIPLESVHSCLVSIPVGSSLLSEMTAAEIKEFGKNAWRKNVRLACQARIDRSGEIVVMTEESKKAPIDEKEPEKTEKDFKKEFADLPLEKKIANLLELEAITLGDTLSYIFNSPFNVAGKLMDVMANFGFRKEESEKKSARPKEHTKAHSGTEKKASAKTDTKSRRRPAPKKDEDGKDQDL
jgi:ferredoxin